MEDQVRQQHEIPGVGWWFGLEGYECERAVMNPTTFQRVRYQVAREYGTGLRRCNLRQQVLRAARGRIGR